MLAFILYPEYVGIIPSSGLCICFSHCCGQFCIRSLHGCLLTVYVSGQVSSWKSPPCVTLSNAVAPFSNIPFQNYPVPLLYMATAAWDCFVCLLTCLERISQTRLQLPREKAWYFCSLLLPPVPGVLKKTWWIKTDTHPHNLSHIYGNFRHYMHVTWWLSAWIEGIQVIQWKVRWPQKASSRAESPRDLGQIDFFLWISALMCT